VSSPSSSRAYSIRQYQTADLDTLKAITVICFEHVSIDANIERKFGQLGEHDWKWRKARHIDDDARIHPDGVFVAEHDGRVVGYITSRVDHESKIGWIPNLSVLPESQGQGLGRALMTHCLEYLRGAGMKLAKIETLMQNDIGSSFYPSVGFEEVARQIHYAMPLGSDD
jgi:ribosomal protein S18 acetylase RimI-like enzyme